MLTPEERARRIAIIRDFPPRLTALVGGLSDARLKGEFLPGEWTVQQIVHHLPESHMNSFVRLKLILTEDHPTLKPYDQAAWAELADVDATPIECSLVLLRGLHERWAILFERLTDHQRQRTGYHPENGDMTPDDLLVAYSDHCDIHVEQITRTLAAAPA
jgi:hypothetical protein